MASVDKAASIQWAVEDVLSKNVPAAVCRKTPPAGGVSAAKTWHDRTVVTRIWELP
jgi:hypothetical protein